LGNELQRLKSALWYRIGKIVDDETLKLGVNATPQFIGSLTELTWAQIGMFQTILFPTFIIQVWQNHMELLVDVSSFRRTNGSNQGTAAQDLESFAAHAGRRTIKTDDVLLLGRRNEGLETILKECVEGLKVRKTKTKENRAGKGKG
jgi:centromere protein S